MKAELVIYKILSFLLLPFAALLAINCVTALLIALSNPPILIVLFLFACVAIYIIASYNFLTRGIDKNSPRKPVLRDWIRINGFITLLLCLFAIPLFTGVKLQPSDAKMIMEQIEKQNGMKLGMSLPEFQNLLNGFIIFLTVVCSVLLVHIIITFRMVKRFRYLFEPDKMDFE